MSKAKRAKYTSKGQCRNSKLHKPAIMPIGGNMNNVMREAFLSAQVSDSVVYSYLGNIIIKSLKQPPKLTADQVKGWSTKLSFRTFKELQAQGVLA